MRGTFLYSRLALAHLQDMVHGLVGEPVFRHNIMATDSGKQGTGCLTPDLVHPELQPLPGTVRDIGQPFLIPFSQHLQRPVAWLDIFLTQRHCL